MTDPIGTAHIIRTVVGCTKELAEMAAKEIDQSRIAEVGRLEERVAELWEAIFRVKDRCWEADDANWQHDILSIVVPLTDAKIDEVRAALSLQRGV